MKIRNFAFFGVMAAILSVSAANATGEPVKKIASTNYVKTHAAGADYNNTTSGLEATTIQTAIDELASESATAANLETLAGRVTTAEGNITTNANDIDTLDSTKQDKVAAAVENNITTWNAAGQTKDSGKAFTTTVRATGSADDNSIPTESAVRAAISAVDNSADLSALEGRMDTAEGDIDALEGRMGTAENDIDTLESTVSGHTTDITNLGTNKQDRPATATANNIAIFNGTKDTIDSNKAFTTTVSASSTDAQIPTALAVQTAISGAVDTAIDGVTYPTVNISGDNALANFDGATAANQDTHCTESSPCVLSYAGLDAQNKPKYKWTSIEDFNY